ncbi:MAG: sulfide/dihydroorotate dehydrogenase-like FAD/NAD-binding protein, partial [Paludibacteraceae bacterium]|nr:sulfide/dihydroorotate dehydrogenase-like FAD/NAD-binding protein [Paludibacteraceae bacterium]
MNKVLSKRFFSDNVAELVIEAPEIARSRRAGHFVIVRVDEHSERMPLTISNADTEKGTITLVVQRIGVSSSKLCALNVGDELADLVGPLGKATHITNFGTVVCACGGVGAAPMLPIAEALKKAGNRVITVLAARTAELIILREELAKWSDEVIVMTDDGSMGEKGLVTAGIEKIIAREKVDKCITIGPAIMMKFVALTTKKYDIPTDASLNTIMVDGTGMCGACRVTVGGKTKFVCVDGPEFDAHQVDFDEMLSRLRSYKPEEAAAYEQYMQYTRPMTAKERAELPRVKMNEVPANVRTHSLRMEVNQGLTLTQALTEAKRCLNCKNAGCVQGCPVGIDIPAFIHQLSEGDILGAADIIKQSSSLPSVCGRVCPQEKQCEAQCIHHKMQHEPVAIGYLERFVADYAAQAAPAPKTEIKRNHRKIAVVGSGPSSLSFAGDMAKLGYSVCVFEALHEIGGVLKYGIPEFRLPNRIVDIEIDNLRRLGVEFRKDTIIGKTIAVEDLRKQGFEGIFVGSGAGLPRFMGIPGENLNGVMSCNEYLTRVNLMDASNMATDTPLLYGKNVAVIGGGNTAMDAVRTAKRLGAER